MQAQTLSLEGKLTLLETAINNQTIKQEELANNLIAAINALQGSLETKIDAITAAITAQSTALETKLGLIEAAVQAQTLSLEGRLALLETALNDIAIHTNALGIGQTEIANEISLIHSQIQVLVAEVNAGLINVDTAIAQIVAKLEEIRLALP